MKYYPGGNRRARTITLEGIDWSTTRDESEGEGQETIEWHEQLDAAAWLVIQCNYVSERMLINRLGI